MAGTTESSWGAEVSGEGKGDVCVGRGTTEAPSFFGTVTVEEGGARFTAEMRRHGEGVGFCSRIMEMAISSSPTWMSDSVGVVEEDTIQTRRPR